MVAINEPAKQTPESLAELLTAIQQCKAAIRKGWTALRPHHEALERIAIAMDRSCSDGRRLDVSRKDGELTLLAVGMVHEILRAGALEARAMILVREQNFDPIHLGM